jgi:hypothetical protein
VKASTSLLEPDGNFAKLDMQILVSVYLEFFLDSESILYAVSYRSVLF